MSNKGRPGRRLALPTGFILFFNNLFHAITFSFNNHSLSMVEQPVKQRRCQRAVIIEDFRPFLKHTVGCDHKGTLFISLADDLEEQIRPVFIDGQVTQFIQDNQCWV